MRWTHGSDCGESLECMKHPWGACLLPFDDLSCWSLQEMSRHTALWESLSAIIMDCKQVLIEVCRSC